MVELRYSDYYEEADLAGQSVGEAREQFKAEFGIPDKAEAKLNGKKVKESLESETCLNDNDKLSFAETRGKGAFLVGALLLALTLTGSVFAYGYVTTSTSLNAVAAGGDFVKVSVNNTSFPSWTPYGLFKGSITGGPIFDIDTATVDYTGDMVATVSIANGDDLVNAYRVLAMFVEVRDSANSIVDINADGDNNTDDFALLTLGNGAVDLFINQGASSDYYTIKVKSGFYVSHIWGSTGWAGKENPLLYVEIAQR